MERAIRTAQQLKKEQNVITKVAMEWRHDIKNQDDPQTWPLDTGQFIIIPEQMLLF